MGLEQYDKEDELFNIIILIAKRKSINVHWRSSLIKCLIDQRCSEEILVPVSSEDKMELYR